MSRRYSTIFTGSETCQRKLPLSLRHKVSPFHHRLLAARIALLQRIIPCSVSLTFDQLSYCVYIDKTLKVPERILPKLNSNGYLKQSEISNRGYRLLVNEIERLAKERMISSYEIKPASFVSRPILTDFMRQFNRLIQLNNLGYSGCLTEEVTIDDYISLKDEPRTHDLTHLPQMIMPHETSSTGVKIHRRERHRILTSILGMISIEHPEKVNELIREWVFLGKNGNHQGLLDLVMMKWNRF